MKQVLFILFFLLNCLLGYTQVFDVETIKGDANNNAKRINLVILSDGYQITELDQFKTDAESFVTNMFSQSPFNEYSNYFNVHIIKVPSNESGADHPGTATDVTEPFTPITTADSYFNATFDAFNFHRLLYYEIDGNNANGTYTKITSVLANNFPTYDQALILVNSNVYGGSGGEFPMASTGTSASEIAIHELGHSLFNLKDEYYPGDGLAGEAINMTQETNPSLVKWKNWIGINSIGIYPYGTSGMSATWNRPHQNCKMRYLGVPFCSVCKEGMVEKIHSLISPIDSYLPVSNSVNTSTYPINFQLNLIKPIPNTLESTWTLNTTNFANNVDDITVLETDLNTGTNNLTVVVNDNSSFLKVDNHETIHVYSVTWTITKSALTIDDITSKENNLIISLYPNPSNNLINLKVESNNAVNLKVDVVSLDGKLLKTTSVSNFENQQINISNLSQGIYLTNFYADNILLATKRFIKN